MTFVEIGGTVGSLLSGGARISRMKAPPLVSRPDVTIKCAGLKSLRTSISIELATGESVLRLINRHGGQEKIDGKPSTYDFSGTTFWNFTTADASHVLERAIVYLDDPVVLEALAPVQCESSPEKANPPGCDLRVMPVEVQDDPHKYQEDKMAACKAFESDVPRGGPTPSEAIFVGKSIADCDPYGETALGKVCGDFVSKYAITKAPHQLRAFYERSGFVLWDPAKWSFSERHYEVSGGQRIPVGGGYGPELTWVRLRPPKAAGMPTIINITFTHCVPRPKRD
ncbi:MAG: hypothetical protein LC750_16225 [Actinobacteria bacterium]|nr:hypothetical protein [Actinomycetota bacterium]